MRGVVSPHQTTKYITLHYNTMTDQQITTIKCAYADMVGAYQAYRSLDIHSHDWEAHLLSVEEMERDFPFLSPMTDPQVNQGIVVESCSCGKNHEPDWSMFLAFNENGNPLRNHEGSLELFFSYEEAVLNTTGDLKPIQIMNAPVEIQNEIRRENKKHIQSLHNTMKHNNE